MILNKEALAARMKTQKRLDDGFFIAYYEQFQESKQIEIPQAIEANLLQNGYDLPLIKKNETPKLWSIDLESISPDFSSRIQDKGYSIVSNQEALRLVGPRFDGMRSSFIFEFSIKNNGDSDCNICFGVFNSGLIKNRDSTLISRAVPEGETSVFEIEIGVFDQYTNIAPTLTVKGSAILTGFKVYQKIHDDFTVVEGEIVERSVLPDPKQSDYPDCRYTAHFIGNEIASGSPCNKELSLSIDGFRNKTILPTESLKKGDKVRIGIVSIDSVGDDLASIQEADDLSLFSLQNYLVNSVEVISNYTNYSELNPVQISFLDSDKQAEYLSIYQRDINPPVPEDLKEVQKQQIKNDLERINIVLASYSEEIKAETNRDFESAWNIEKRKYPSDYNRISGVVWRNIDNSFWALPESFKLIDNYIPISQWNIESFVAFRDYLETQGVQLIVSLVPNSYDIAARVINKDFSKVPDFRTIVIVKQLLENNIEVVYPSEEIIKNYSRYEIPFFYPNDPHPGDLPQDVLSDMISDRLSRFKFEKKFDSADFSIKKEFSKNLVYPDKCDIGNNAVSSPYPFHRAYYKNKVIQNDPNSPVLILGNSFSFTPSGNSLSELITYKTHIPVAYYSITGTGILSSCIQRIFNHPESFLTDRKVIVLQIGTIHLEKNIAIPNIKLLDEEKTLLSNRRLIKTFQPAGNTESIPEFAAQLIDPSIFQIPADGSVKILDAHIQSDLLQESIDSAKDICLEIICCYPANKTTTLEINNQLVVLPSVQDSYLWCRKVVQLSSQTQSISIRVLGEQSSFIAIGGIKIYQ